jgi:hypothetical protein
MHSLQLQKRNISTLVPDLVEEQRRCADFSLSATAGVNRSRYIGCSSSYSTLRNPTNITESLRDSAEDAELFIRPALHTNRPDARKNWIAAVIFMQVARAAAMSGALFSGIIAILFILRGG